MDAVRDSGAQLDFVLVPIGRLAFLGRIRDLNGQPAEVRR